ERLARDARRRPDGQGDRAGVRDHLAALAHRAAPASDLPEDPGPRRHLCRSDHAREPRPPPAPDGAWTPRRLIKGSPYQNHANLVEQLDELPVDAVLLALAPLPGVVLGHEPYVPSSIRATHALRGDRLRRAEQIHTVELLLPLQRLQPPSDAEQPLAVDQPD